MNRVCSYCGNNIGDTSKQFNRFCCPKCGTRVEEEEEDCEFGKIKY